MAMSKAVLGPAIANCIIDKDASPEMKAKITKMWTDIAGEIISHIQTSAQVNSGIPVSTAGSPTAQTGATTGPGTIS